MKEERERERERIVANLSVTSIAQKIKLNNCFYSYTSPQHKVFVVGLGGLQVLCGI
jgi:hypothetical protein